MSNNNEEQKENLVIKKRRINNLINKHQYKNSKKDSRCLTVENTQDKDHQLKPFDNNKKLNLSNSYKNFNNKINLDNKTNMEKEIDFMKQPKLNFVPRINRHKKNLDKFINVSKENENDKPPANERKVTNKTHINLNKRKKRSLSTEPNDDKENKYISQNQKDNDLIINRIKHSSTKANSVKKEKKDKDKDKGKIYNITYENNISPEYVCKNCYDKKMLEEKLSSLSKSMIDNKEKLVDQFINENPFYFVDKMSDLEKKRIQKKLDNLSNKQRNVLPVYEQEVNQPKNLRKEKLQLINEYSINPLAIEHGKDPKFIEHKKKFFDRKEKLIQSNPDIYQGLGPRKAFQDYYEKCMYQIPFSEEIYSINPVYKNNYINTLKNQIIYKEKREKDLAEKTKAAELLANKQFEEYKNKEKLNDLKKLRLGTQMLYKDNQKLEEYKKCQKENKQKEEEKYGYKLDLMKDKENKDYKLRYKYEKNMDNEMYKKMFDEMNQKKEKKITNRNEEKKKWNNYLDRFNIRYGYKNRYNNCDECNIPIKNQKKQIKIYPQPKENVENINH